LRKTLLENRSNCEEKLSRPSRSQKGQTGLQKKIYPGICLGPYLREAFSSWRIYQNLKSDKSYPKFSINGKKAETFCSLIVIEHASLNCPFLDYTEESFKLVSSKILLAALLQQLDGKKLGF